MLKDIENSVNCISDRGLILVHDVGPITKKDTLPSALGDAYRAWITTRKELNSLYCCCLEMEEGEIIGVIKKDASKPNPWTGPADCTPLIEDRGRSVYTSLYYFYDADKTWQFYNNNRGEILNIVPYEQVVKLSRKKL